jgi:hypothetical protein
MVIEPEPGRWFYLLQMHDDEYFEWGNGDANAYGPFDSQAKAIEHLNDNHANPGGYWVTPHTEFKMTPTVQKLLDGAPNNMRIQSGAIRFG